MSIKNRIHDFKWHIIKGLLDLAAKYRVNLRPIEKDDFLYSHYSEESLREKRFLNIGAGRFHHPYWINVDYGTEWYKGQQINDFVNHNLMSLEPLPFESGSIELIFASHVIEHISDEAVGFSSRRRSAF